MYVIAGDNIRIDKESFQYSGILSGRATSQYPSSPLTEARQNEV